MKLIVGHFEPDGALIYLPIGFEPDLFRLWDYATAPLCHTFFGQMEDDEASGAKEGIKDDGDGSYSKLGDDGGFAAYDTGTQKSISAWAASTAYSLNDLVVASSTGVDDNGLLVGQEQVYKCTTAGTSDSSEPTWPSEFDAYSASDNGVIWQKVGDEAIYRYGYQGIRIAADLMTNGQECYYEAFLADSKHDWGDVDGWSGGIYGS